jgi:hypothetical protein
MAIIGECLLKTKILAAFLLMAPLSGMAQHHHHGMRHFDHHQAHRGGWDWVAPAVIGGTIVYGLNRPAPVIVQQPPIYIQQPTIVDSSRVVIIDGVSYIKQSMVINGITQEVLIRQ